MMVDEERTVTFEELLAQDGRLVYKTKGVSMEPMLRQNRDLIFIEVPKGRLRKYDVALYKKGSKYILHRVIRVKDDHYLIRGDNTYYLETIPDDAVIGVLTGFLRDGRKIFADNPAYQVYVRVWNGIYLMRLLYKRCRRFAVRLAGRLGILPFVRKLLYGNASGRKRQER